jgi:hypothetical protein
MMEIIDFIIGNELTVVISIGIENDVTSFIDTVLVLFVLTEHNAGH